MKSSIAGWLRAALVALPIAITGACAQPGGPPQTSAVRSASEQRTGDRAHEQILAQYGGVYRNSRLQSYVDGIGERIAAVSEQPGEKWTFTVLDSPIVNAFAIPGGYVYVTRGMVALANDEAELAGVIGHEIGHVTAGHSALRQTRATTANIGLLAGAIGLSALGVDPSLAGGLLQAAAGGALASYSRSDEIEADYLGIRYLARAGYDPFAKADILDSLAASSAIEAKTAGRGYDPNRVDFFASHPATGPRTRQAVETARQAGAVTTVGNDRGQDRHLAAIDGMVWGPSPEQGFVDGTRFVHPNLGFAFEAPRGFQLTNRPDAVVGAGPSNTRLIFDGGAAHGGRLTGYIEGTWAPQIARQVRTGRLQSLESLTINGQEAARAVLPVQLNGQAWDALLVAVRHRGKVYRFTGLAPQGVRALPALAEAASTFRQLTSGEAAQVSPRRIVVTTVRRGDTVESLAREMRVDEFPVDRFRALNSLGAREQVVPGMRVKLIR